MADAGDLIREIFADSDSEAEFEGFDQDDVVQDNVVQDNVDRDFPSDVQLGWERHSDWPPIVVPCMNDNSGLSANIDNESLQTPMDFLDLFIKNEDFISWAEQTNIYAEQMLQRRGLLSPFARMNKWTEITGAEMKQWLGLVIATGLVEKPCMEDYWSTDPTRLLGRPQPQMYPPVALNHYTLVNRTHKHFIYIYIYASTKAPQTS